MAGHKDGPFDGRGGRLDIFVNLSAAEIARRCAAFEPMLAALRDAKQALWDSAHTSGDPDDPANMDGDAVDYRACRDAIAKAEGR